MQEYNFKYISQLFWYSKVSGVDSLLRSMNSLDLGKISLFHNLFPIERVICLHNELESGNGSRNKAFSAYVAFGHGDLLKQYKL